MRKLLLSAFLLVSILASASKAMTLPFLFVQPDGTALQVVCHGDEYFSYVTTLDGVLLVRYGDAFYVANVMTDGTLRSSDVIAHEARQRSEAEQRVVESQDRMAFYTASDAHTGQARYAFGDFTLPSGYPPYVQHSGSVRIPVVFVEFPDEKFQEGNIDVLKQNLMDEDYTPKTAGMSFFGTKYSSVRQYYADSSNGQLDLQFEFYGPYQTPNQKHHYAYQNGKGSTGPRLMHDILPMADADMDFANYDNDGDGLADIVVFICAGKIAQTGFDKENDIWSACGSAGSVNSPAYVSEDGVGVCRYCYDSELLTDNYNGNKLHSGIGIFCHEFAHALGMPDLYYTADWAGYNNGPEAWDLMDAGENIRNGFWPIPLTIWERYDFGWITPVVLDQPQDVTVWPLNDPEGRGKAYVIRNPANEDEFWTIENIPADGWYAGLYGKGTGIVIQHVNYSDEKFIRAYPNSVQGHPNCTMIPADGWLYFEIEDLKGDPYPGSKGKTSVEAYKNYAGEEDLVNLFPITDIVLNADGSVSFRFMGGNPSGILQHSTHEAPQRGTFNLSGQKVGGNVSQHGIYIIDGKRVVR